MIGPIRQEILSGIKDFKVFKSIQKELSVFPDLEIQLGDYDRAAQFYNTLRKKGIIGSDIDMLLCAVASGWDIPVFTTDKDFNRFAKYLPIRLHNP